MHTEGDFLSGEFSQLLTPDSVPTMLWFIDAHSERALVNQHWLQFTGRSERQFSVESWEQTAHPADRAEFGDSFRRAFAKRQQFDAQFRLLRADGEYRWVLARGSPRYDRDGVFLGYVGSTVDITETRSLAAAVRNSEHRFRRLVENSPDVIYRLSGAPLRIDYISPAVTGLLGYTPREFYEDPTLPLRIVHPEDRHGVDAALALEVAELRNAVLVRWQTRDGETVWAEHQLSTIVDDDGQLIGIEGVARNVTGRVQAQRALAASEAQFRLLAEHAQDMIYRLQVRPDVGIGYISPAVAQMTGYEPMEFYADPGLPLRIVHPEDRKAARQMLTGRAAGVTRLRWIHRDGWRVWIDHRNVPIYDERQRLTAIEGIGRDVTSLVVADERVRLAELSVVANFRKSAQQLRELVSRLQTLREDERTSLARELHDNLGHILAAIKLDLVPLVLPAASAGLPADRLREALDAVDRACALVTRISSDLRPGALDHLGLGDALESYAAGVTTKTGIRCRVSTAKTRARVDREQSTALFRIVQEAMTNVLRHAHASAVRISLKQTSRQLVLTVQDNGRGIAMSEVNDPRAIGLLGMRERAQMIGADFDISGRTGKGTTVTVTISTPPPVPRKPPALTPSHPR